MNQTEIAALRLEIAKACDNWMPEIKIHPKLLEKVLDQLEAERQRADVNAQEIRKLESQWEHRSPTQWAYDQACAALHAQRERAKKAEAQLASLKGDQVPFRYMAEWSSPNGGMECDYSEVRSEMEDLAAEHDGFVIELFTAPQKPVVLPNKITQSDAPEIAEISAQVERLGLKGTYGAYAAGWNAAIEAAGGTVKDGE